MDENFGDDIMSAIDLFATVGERTGAPVAAGVRRVVLTLDGKFLSHIEQVLPGPAVPACLPVGAGRWGPAAALHSGAHGGAYQFSPSLPR